MSQITETSDYLPRDAGAAPPGRGRVRAAWRNAWRGAERTARHALGWPGRVHRARQVMHALGRLGDAELRDIGLTRLDLHAAAALPFDTDPSALLRRRAEERRRRR